MSPQSSTYHDSNFGHSTTTSSSNSLRSNNDISNQSLEGNSRRRFRRAFHSRRLSVSDLGKHTPWFETKEGKAAMRSSYWTIVSFVILAILGSGALIALTYLGIPKHEYCLVLDEQFSGTSIDSSIWTREVQAGTKGANGFAMMTSSSNNSYVKDGRLYIVPTLTSDSIGISAVDNGYTLNLTQSGTCTALNSTDCVAFSSNVYGNISIIPPIQSAQLTTRLSRAIRYGRVEVKATMPSGDWLWPAVRLLPRDSVYGVYPTSGEVDIVASRGNAVTSQQDQFANTVQSSLHWGPQAADPGALPYDGALKTTHIQQLIRKYWTEQDFVYGVDWDQKSIYTWYTSRVREIMRRDFTDTFWKLGNFNVLGVDNPWANSNNTNVAPFDQAFYLSISLGVGGTTGYWQDPTEGKPWTNRAPSAMSDFWNARTKWLSNWSTVPEKRAFSIDYVKIWSIKEPGVACPVY